ncbi:signal recognition particle subunit SRP54 [Azospirillum lipoferum]|nr:signal recognition particle subunit SRP54 [Azospirillum lipoferum]
MLVRVAALTLDPELGNEYRMFEGLTGRLGDIFDKLRRRGALTEEDVSAALREVRVALLEADVALPVVKQFVTQVKERAVGQEVLKSVTPGQQVIKIVHDNLVEMLGEGSEINLNAAAPVPILMVGLQGSGKTTSTAKIALRLKTKDRKKVLMASLDVRRPAAQEQLKVLGEQTGVATLPIVPGQDPVAIAKRAIETGRLEGYDIVMLDTAGRLAIDEELMAEVAAVRDATKPVETLLVADAMTGQDAVTVATNFNDKVGITGIVLTRIDGDARGGAALSMRQITGKPIKLLGVGEKIDALEPFHPDRIAGRILGMGDVVSLVEKAVETIDKDEAEKLARKMEKGQGFDLDDMAMQLKQLRKMGGMSGLMGMLPGIGKIKDQLKDANVDDGMIKRQEAIISSMTKAERRNPDIIKASRRKRIAAGSGTSVQEVNKLLKQFETMRGMMKQVQKLGKKGMLRGGLGNLLPKGLGGFGGKGPFG